MDRLKGKIAKGILILFFILSAFTLKDDRFFPCGEGDSAVFLQSLYKYFQKIDLIELGFEEKVFIPFLGKWNDFKGKALYRLRTNLFMLELKNETKDRYISNGRKIIYEYTDDGRTKLSEYDTYDESLAYLVPDEKKWTYFDKTVFRNSENDYLVRLVPKDETFEFEYVEFIIKKRNFALSEIAFLGRDKRILHFRINGITFPEYSEKKIRELFRISDE